MWWHTRRNQILSSSETDESIYIGGDLSSVEYWLSWSAGRRRTIVVTLDGLFRVKLKTAGYPLHSPLSPSLLLPCVAVCHQFPFPLYRSLKAYCSTLFPPPPRFRRSQFRRQVHPNSERWNLVGEKVPVILPK